MNEKYIINFSSLDNLKEKFENNKKNFTNLSYSTFSSSYVKKCSDYNIQQMSNQLDKLYLKIKESYEKMDKWLIEYINNTKGIEAKLSNKSGYSQISDSPLISQINNIKKLPTVTYDVKSSFNVKKSNNNAFSSTLETRNKVTTPNNQSINKNTKTKTGNNKVDVDKKLYSDEYIENEFKKEANKKIMSQIAPTLNTGSTNSSASASQTIKKAAVTENKLSDEEFARVRNKSTSSFTTTLEARSNVMAAPKTQIGLEKKKFIVYGTKDGLSIECNDKEAYAKSIMKKNWEKIAIEECSGNISNSATSTLASSVINGAGNYSDSKTPINLNNKDIKLNEEALKSFEQAQGHSKIDVASATTVFGTSIGEGVALFGEGVYDSALTTLTLGFKSGFYIKANGETTDSFTEWLEDTKNEVESLGFEFEYIDDGYFSKYCPKEKLIKEIKTEHVKDFFDSFYETNSIGKSLKDSSGAAFDITRGVGNGLGYVAPAIAATVVTGGAGASGVVASAMGAGVTMTSSFGSHVEEALNNGASFESAKGIGAAGAMIDAAQFFAGANVNAVSTKVFSSIANPFVKSALISATNVAFDSIDGATSTFVDPFLQSFYAKGYVDSKTGKYVEFDKNTSYFEKFGKMFENTGGWSSVLSNSLLAGALSAISEGIDLPSKLNSSKNETNLNIKNSDIKTEISNMVNDSEKLKVLVTGLNDSQLKNILNLDSSSINNIDYQKIVKSMNIDQIKTALDYELDIDGFNRFIKSMDTTQIEKLFKANFNENQIKKILVNLNDDQLDFVKKNKLIKNISTGTNNTIINQKNIELGSLTNNEKINLLNNCNLEVLEKLFKDTDFVNSNKNLVIEKILKNQDTLFFKYSAYLDKAYSNEMLDFIINNKTEILPKLSNESLTILAIEVNDSYYKKILPEIEKRLNSGNLIIDKPIREYQVVDLDYDFNTFFGRLPQELQTKLIDLIDEKTSNFNIENLNFKVGNIQKLNLMRLNAEGVLDESGIEILNKVFNENHRAANYFNANLLDKKIIKVLGEDYIVDIGRYSNLSDKLVAISKNENVFNFFSEMVDNFKKDDSLGQFYIKNESLINYFFDNYEQLKNIDFNKIDYDDFMDYIIFTKYSFNGASNKKIPINYSNNYKKEFYEFLDAQLERKYSSVAFRANDMKDIYFQKYFSISLDEARDFVNKYGEYFSKLNLPDSNAKSMMNMIEKVLDMDSKDELYSLYHNQKFTFSSEEMINIDSEIKHAYFNTYINELEKTSTKLKNKILSNSNVVDYNGKKVNIIDADSDFSFLVYSSDTGYVVDKTLTNNSYIDTWKDVSESAHAISTSYINETNLGTAPVINTGVLYAFNDIGVNDIGIMAPYDVNSHLCSYGFKSGNKQIYIPASEMENSTTRVYNELVLNRQVAKPDYVIVYTDFPESLYTNALKAASEWDIPIVKIDRINLAKTQVAKIDDLISKFSTTKNVDSLIDALNIYESSTSGYHLNTIYRENNFKNLVDNNSIDTLFLGKDKEIENVLETYITELGKNNDKSNLEKLDIALNKIKSNYDISNQNGSKEVANTKSLIDIDKYLNMIKEMI